MFAQLKRVLIGTPLRTEQLAHERLTNFKALAVLSSDALSSVAYGTEEVLLMLMLAGSAALRVSLPIGLAIAGLMAIVAISYRQTIFAYPTGGGSYIVAKDNLGTLPGLTAGAALLIDYVLTVAVSISSGVAAITSAFPSLLPYRVEIALGAILLISLANLRGVRESGSIFAAPTYVFIVSMFVLLGVGFFKLIFFGLPPVPVTEVVQAQQELGLFLILRAFSSGCSAMTGVEAISDGVPAFRDPVSRNAAKTLVWMASVLIAMFVGITYLTFHLGIHPIQGETVLSQLARAIVGQGWFYYLVQAATALILFLAANTSYSDFPRLASWIARDGFLPRQLGLRGDRLVFSNGIVLLGILSSALVIHYKGETHAMIPLYAVGVFLSFTLSQSGMVVRWWRQRSTNRSWLMYALINGLGASITAIVLVVISVTKFVHGAWMIIALIPVVVMGFRMIKRHYTGVADSLRMEMTEPIQPVRHTLVVPVAGVNKAVASAVAYAITLSDDVRAVHVSTDPEATEKIQAKWNAWNPGVPLIVLPSPYRSVLLPFVEYIEAIELRERHDRVTVVVPEFVPKQIWHHLLHNQSALMLRTALHFKRNIVLVSVPYHLNQ